MDTPRIFGDTQKATKAAMDIIHGAIKGKVDSRDVEVFNKLRPEDFHTLIQEGGFDAALTYIRKMEAKRLGID